MSNIRHVMYTEIQLKFYRNFCNVQMFRQIHKFMDKEHTFIIQFSDIFKRNNVSIFRMIKYCLINSRNVIR